jgi:sortase A
MRARVSWSRPKSGKRRYLLGIEYFFLLLGLVALDCYIWVNTSSTLYQAYQDWAFDQTLRGLTPSVGGFIEGEFSWFKARQITNEPVPEPSQALAPLPAEKPPAHSMVLGRLEIPRLRVKVMVREGADESTLQRAVGHIPGTALPGSIGNVALAGHRDTFFRGLRNIQKNDAINLKTEDGTYRYVVQSTKIVGPRDVGVLAASTGETLTLVTCYPFYYIGSAPKRFIVRATQVAAIPPSQPQRGS